MDDPTMTLKEAAAYLKMNSDTVRNLIKAGRLPAAKVANKWRIKREDINAMFKLHGGNDER